MPLVIPNTTVNNVDYDAAHTFQGNDVFASGYFTIANNPVQCQIFQGVLGQSKPIAEQYLPPGTYQLVSNPKNPFAGLRVKRGAAGVDSQIFGAFWYPHESVLQGGNPFTTLVAPSGSVTSKVPGTEVAFNQYIAPVTITAINEATANTIVALPSTAFDGTTRLYFEFFTPALTSAAGAGNIATTVVIFEDGVAIGQIAQSETLVGGTVNPVPILAHMFRTPSAGNHTYDARAWRTGAVNAIAQAGNGGAGAFVPGYLRAVVA